MPPGPEDLAAVTVNCLWNQEKKTTYDYIVVPEARFPHAGCCMSVMRTHRACSGAPPPLACLLQCAKRRRKPRPRTLMTCLHMMMSTPPFASSQAYAVDCPTLFLAALYSCWRFFPLFLRRFPCPFTVLSLSFHCTPTAPYSTTTPPSQALDKALHADEAVSDMLIEEVYRSQDLDATLSSMSDDEDEDEDEDAYLPPLKAVMGELPVAGVRQKPLQAEEEEVRFCVMCVQCARRRVLCTTAPAGHYRTKHGTLCLSAEHT